MPESRRRSRALVPATAAAAKPAARPRGPPRRRHSCVRVVSVACFAAWACVALLAAAVGFCTVKGVPLDQVHYEKLLGVPRGEQLREAIGRGWLFRDLSAQARFVVASTVFVVACGVCGLFWVVNALAKASDSRMRPAAVLKRLQVRRAQLHKKLDEPDLEQEVRVECLRELEQCTSQLAVLEEQIVDLWTNHAAELCLSTVQQKQRLHQQQQEQQKQD